MVDLVSTVNFETKQKNLFDKTTDKEREEIIKAEDTLGEIKLLIYRKIIIRLLSYQSDKIIRSVFVFTK